MINVFTYGTLMSGYPNNRVMNYGRTNGRLLHTYASTENKYAMVNLGGFPGVIDPGEDVDFVRIIKMEAEKNNLDLLDYIPKANIVGEVWYVDELTHLDNLEGHPSFYKRNFTPITVAGRLTLHAWCYFLPTSYLSFPACDYREFGSESYAGWLPPVTEKFLENRKLIDKQCA